MSKNLIILKATKDTPVVKTSRFPRMRLEFDDLWPTQSILAPYYDQDVNIVAACPTASGKTLIAELCMDAAMAKDQTCLYAGPLKSISEEKRTRWTSAEHGFGGKNVAVLTGDYLMTDELRARLRQADIILLTSEILDARGRQGRKEKITFLNQAGLLVVDEIHLLGDEERGDRCETGLMAVTQYNPDVRLVMLSATLKNGQDIARWATLLNGKPTVLMESSWRPTKLHLKMVPFVPLGTRWAEKQEAKITRTVELVQSFGDDPSIIFVYSKKDGRDTMFRLKREQIKAEFYHAERNLKDRKGIIRRFNEGKLHKIVSTSGLGAGIDMGFKNVVMCGTARGTNPVKPTEIQQCLGRAGRPGYFPDGYAYVVVLHSEEKEWFQKIRTLPVVRSQLEGTSCLRFHVVSLIDRKRARTPEGLVRWQRRSLMAIQGKPLSEQTALALFRELEHSGIVRKKGGGYTNTMVGKVASRLYFDPMAVMDWTRNWEDLSDRKLWMEDIAVAWAIGRSCHFDGNYVASENRPYAESVEFELQQAGLDPGPWLPSIAAVRAGMKEVKLPGLASIYNNIKGDIWRMMSGWRWLMERRDADLPENYFERLSTRVSYQVDWDMADLCRVPAIGAVRAKKLFRAGAVSPWHLVAPESKGGLRATARELLGEKVYDKAILGIQAMKEQGNISLKKP